MKIRESNYEFLRIVSMIAIVIWHVIVHGELLEKTTGAVNFAITAILFFMAFHVTVFMLTTGFYQSKSNFKLEKLFYLFLEIGFYNFIINTILYFTGLVNYTNDSYLRSILFFNLSALWYIQKYIIVYILSPFLNKFIDISDRLFLKKLIISMIVCYVVFPFFSDCLLYYSDGYTVGHYIMLYFIGAYIRKYNLTVSCFTKLNKTQKQFLYIFIFLASWFFNIMFYFLGKYFITLDSNILISIGQSIVDRKYFYSNPFIVIQGISLFMLFGTFKIHSKVINFIASAMLGIYIIHESSFLQHNIYTWLGISSSMDLIYGKKIIIDIFIIAFVIFVSCLFIELIRKFIFNLLFKVKWIQKLIKKIDVKSKNIIEIN